MSESTSENESGASTSSDDTEGAITDEQLPDDLRPDKNPLAGEPDDSEDGGISAPGPDGPAAG